MEDGRLLKKKKQGHRPGFNSQENRQESKTHDEHSRPDLYIKDGQKDATYTARGRVSRNMNVLVAGSRNSRKTKREQEKSASPPCQEHRKLRN